MNSGELQVNTPNKAIKVETKTALTFSVASALKKKVLNGEAIFKKDLPVILEITEETETGLIEKTIKIPANTVMSWIKRDTLIPNSNKSLRDYLNEAREQRDIALTKRQKQAIKHLSMREMMKIINMPTESNKKEVITNYTKDKQGKDVEIGKAVKTTTGDDSEKLRLKVKCAQFVLSNLDNDFKKEKASNTPFSFSFLKLAERRDEMIREGILKV